MENEKNELPKAPTKHNSLPEKLPLKLMIGSRLPVKKLSICRQTKKKKHTS